MSYDFKLMYLYGFGIIVTIPVGIILWLNYGGAVSAIFDISIAGILGAVVVLLSRRHRRLVGWRWRRPGRRGLLAALANVAAVAGFFALVIFFFFRLPVWLPPWLPFLLFGVGIGSFNVLKAMGVVAIREVQFLNPSDPSAASAKTPLSRRARVLKLSAGALLLLGFVGWFGGALMLIHKPGWISSNTQLPLGDLHCIAVDSQGRIYCGLGFYSRIQVYDDQGRFLRGWWIDATGRLRLHMAEGDRLEVEAIRRDRIFTFDPNGTLIESRQETEAQREDFDRRDQLPVADARGRTFAVRSKLFWPRVVREDQAGRTTIISMPWYLWPIMGPLPAWLFFFVGILLLGLTNILRQMRSRNSSRQ